MTNHDDTPTEIDSSVRAVPRVPDSSEATEKLPKQEKTPGAPGNTPWGPADYAPLVVKSGARKLASSGVAPIVAAARGYESVEQSQAKDFAERWAVGGRNTTRGKQFHGSFIDGGDVLAMPWFKADAQFADAGSIDYRPSVSALQLRPSNPRTNDKGKVVKYEFLTGQETVLDWHPAATREWVHSSEQIIIAEGLLKGDSTLTAQLRRHCTDDELRLFATDVDRVAALKRLALLMERIPNEERVAVLTVAGVGNWRNNPEWYHLRLDSKRVYIAFDADVADNLSVWNMARDLMRYLAESKHATPYIVDLSTYLRDRDLLSALADKSGLDDYFAEQGGFEDVFDMISEDLPTRPEARDADRVGEWRVSDDGFSVEECVAVTGPSGEVIRVEWKTQVRLGGRIINTEVRRGPTEEERRGKGFNAGVNADTPAPGFTKIELTWEDDVLGIQRAEVVGPDSILMASPEQWMKLGARIPSHLLRYHEWPPKSPNWLGAIKKNEREKTADITKWSTMGWVPVEGEDPQAFIVGEQVIAISDNATASTYPGVTENNLARASEFGVDDTYRWVETPVADGESTWELKDPKGRLRLEEDIREVIATLVEDGPWLSRATAITMIAQALRPTCPVPTSIASYYVGPPAKGKSWSARQVMAFWQKVPGTWRNTLPGSAADTFATTEAAVSQTPIWVADDLAPSSDRHASEQAQGKIGDLIRAIHNRLGKRRMNGNDMTARNVPTPMALTIFTAENEHPVQSIQERVVKVQFTGLRTEGMPRANNMANLTTTASRITAAAIRSYILTGRKAGWEDMVTNLTATQARFAGFAKDILEAKIGHSDTERPAGIIADLAMGLHTLELLAERLEMDDVLDQLHWDEGGWYRDLVDQVAPAHEGKQDASPGRVLLDSIRMLLSAGYAHVANADNPAQPPVTTGEDALATNIQLGWAADTMGELRPQGLRIGQLTQKNGVDVLIFQPDTSFDLAKQKFSSRIMAGTVAVSSWKDVWDQRLVHPRYLNSKRRSISLDWKSGSGRIYGVPLSMETLFPERNPVSVADEEHGDDA